MMIKAFLGKLSPRSNQQQQTSPVNSKHAALSRAASDLSPQAAKPYLNNEGRAPGPRQGPSEMKLFLQSSLQRQSALNGDGGAQGLTRAFHHKEALRRLEGTVEEWKFSDFSDNSPVYVSTRGDSTADGGGGAQGLTRAFHHEEALRRLEGTVADRNYSHFSDSSQGSVKSRDDSTADGDVGVQEPPFESHRAEVLTTMALSVGANPQLKYAGKTAAAPVSAIVRTVPSNGKHVREIDGKRARELIQLATARASLLTEKDFRELEAVLKLPPGDARLIDEASSSGRFRTVATAAKVGGQILGALPGKHDLPAITVALLKQLKDFYDNVWKEDVGGHLVPIGDERWHSKKHSDSEIALAMSQVRLAVKLLKELREHPENASTGVKEIRAD